MKPIVLIGISGFVLLPITSPSFVLVWMAFFSVFFMGCRWMFAGQR